MNSADSDIDLMTTGRRRAAVALRNALQSGDGSELDVAQRWVDGMQDAGVAGFWYVPPPAGTSVLSGDAGYERLALESFRPQGSWPSSVEVTDEPVTVYTSPVSRTGLIEDFGLTLYRGSNAAVRAHIQNVANLVKEVTDLAAPGMRYADLYQHARRRWEAAGLRNDIASSTDAAGTNVGHSIPFFGVPRDVADLGEGMPERISKARVFVSSANEDAVEDTCAFTIEPRLGAPGLPVAWFHVMVAFSAGRKHVVTEFDPVLSLPGVDWFANPWA